MSRSVFKAYSLFLFLATPCLAGYYQKVVITPEGTPYLSTFTKVGGLNILKYNPRQEALSIFYSISNPETCHINDSSLDPTGMKIAYSEYCKLPHVTNSNMSAEGYYRLTVLDIRAKKEIVIFKNVERIYSYSPKGDAIVYTEEIPGESGSPAPPGYRGGVWLYNFGTKSEKKINTQKVTARDIYWSIHDGGIYITDGSKVFRYDASDGKGDIVAYKGIYFSPNGKYYVARKSTMDSEIYRTSDNREMIEWENILRKQHFHYFLFWSKRLNSFVFNDGKDNNVIFDIGEGKFVGKFTGSVIGINPNGSLVAIHPRGKRGRDDEKVEIINLLDLLQRQASPPAP